MQRIGGDKSWDLLAVCNSFLKQVSLQISFGFSSTLFAPNGKAEAQRRVYETTTPDKYTNKAKKPRYNGTLIGAVGSSGC